MAVIPEQWAVILDWAEVMTTELNDLADGGLAIQGSDLAGVDELDVIHEFALELSGFGDAPVDGAWAELHFFPKYNTSYYQDNNDGDADADSLPNIATRIGTFYNKGVGTGARHFPLFEGPIELAPSDGRLALVNEFDGALGATGNKLWRRVLARTMVTA
jgi:hypothetical protein